MWSYHLPSYTSLYLQQSTFQVNNLGMGYYNKVFYKPLFSRDFEQPLFCKSNTLLPKIHSIGAGTDDCEAARREIVKATSKRACNKATTDLGRAGNRPRTYRFLLFGFISVPLDKQWFF